MRTSMKYLVALILVFGAVTVVSAATPVSPYNELNTPMAKEQLPAFDKGVYPTEFVGASSSSCETCVGTQSDVTEDNAGNGDPDVDLEDGGWDWVTTLFEHGPTASPMNIYGATAQGLLRNYPMNPDPTYLIALTDAADMMVAIGPDTGIRSAPDVSFLLDFADMPGCPNPAAYRAGAQAIWDRHITVYGTMESLAIAIRDGRAASYPNGIIPWDIGAWAHAAMRMHATFPMGGHDVEGAAIAEVLWQDSFNGNPGYFDPDGHSQGYDPAWNTVDYWWYSLGLTGLIQAFGSTGTHTAELPGLQALLLDCQYPDGSFSDQYGAQGGDSDWQTSAYSMMALADYLPLSPTTGTAIYDGAEWLKATQDVSGAWVYDSGNHYPEIDGECTAALAAAWELTGTALVPELGDDGPIDCFDTQLITFHYTPEDYAPAMRGYEITFEVTGGVVFTGADINDAGDLGAIGTHAYYEVDNGGNWTVTDALLGTTVGVTGEADLFTVLLTPTTDGPVTVTILDYRMRTLDNSDISADLWGADFEVDCTAPLAVWDITATTAHARVIVGWQADETDVDHYEIYRGLRYNATPGVTSYPEYDDYVGDMTPVRPGDRAAADASAEWELAGTSPVGTLNFVDSFMADRGVYWYEVYAVDSTPLYSPAAPDYDGALNYWLGDVEIPYDGYVASGDITQLGTNFGLGDGDGYNNEIDVGPTSDDSGTGFPLTDSVVDFEDLMIFALNYGNVGPAKALPAFDRTMPVFVWSRVDDTTWTLELAKPCAALKGLRLRAALPEGIGAEVVPGIMLGQQSDPIFLRSTGDLDVSLAVMGVGRGLQGSGELLRVSFDAPVELGAVDIDARALDNSKLNGDLVGGEMALPSVFAVRPNYPNPFNPSTTISFDLPNTTFVRVGVYALDGQLVRTLQQEELTAGTHEVIWNGLDTRGQQVASGTYLFRVDAGASSTTHKMLLVK